MSANPAKVSVQLQPQPVCAVCGKVSYSRGGVHPQCVLERADAIRVSRLKKAKKSAAGQAHAPKPAALSPWQRRCPKCRQIVHVRKRTCDCGHPLLESEQTDQ
jgi:hypothetical protein